MWIKRLYLQGTLMRQSMFPKADSNFQSKESNVYDYGAVFGTYPSLMTPTVAGFRRLLLKQRDLECQHMLRHDRSDSAEQ